MRLLLLSAGSLSAQSVIDALGARRRGCTLIGANSIAQAAGIFRCDTVYLAPPAASGDAYIERIEEVIRTERPDLVIPPRDDDVLALARLRERAPRIDCVLLTGTVSVARMMNDKAETARFAARHGLPFAETAEDAGAALGLARSRGLPLIGKPRAGNGARGVVLLRSAAEIERAFASRADLIAQPFLDPPPDMEAFAAPFDAGLPFFFSFPETRQYTVQVVIGPDGKAGEPFGCLAKMTGGQTLEYRRCDDSALLTLCRGYARAVAEEGWRGPLNVQAKRDAAGFVAHELNGRMGGGAGSRALLGFDELAEVVRRFLPGKSLPPLSLAQCDVVQQFLAPHALPREGVRDLETKSVWTRP